MSGTQGYSNLVEELYVAYFGRDADYQGWGNFEAALAAAQAPTDAAGLNAVYSSNAAVKSLVDAFGMSTESAALYSSGSTESFVNAIFENLFNRPAAIAGLEFWTAAIDSGAVTHGEAALAIAAGAQQNTTAQGLLDAQTVANKIGAATALTHDLMDAYLGGTPSGAYIASVTHLYLAGITSTTTAAQYTLGAQTTAEEINRVAPTPVDIALTTGTDLLVAGSGYTVFIATLDNTAGLAAGGQAQTLNPGDSLDGGSQLMSALDLDDYGLGGTTAIPQGVRIVNISLLNIASQEAVVGDFSNWAGLANLNVNAATGDDNIAVADNVEVRVSSQTGNVTVSGGVSVFATTDAAHVINISSNAAVFSAIVGDSASTISDTTAGASITVNAGGGADIVVLGAGATANITLAAHSAHDTVVLGASGASLTSLVEIVGLNPSGDAIAFSGETAYTLSGFTEVTQAQVAATGANPAVLESWVAAADGAAGGGVTGGAHTVTWFQYQGLTFILESVAGPSADGGSMAAGNTLVELTGTGYTFSHATGANGTVHLLG